MLNSTLLFLSGMWEMMKNEHNGGLFIDNSSSFFVGDAAGRDNDFSCSDRKFAANAKIDFKTPEEFFLGQLPQSFSWGAAIPTTTATGTSHCSLIFT